MIVQRFVKWCETATSRQRAEGVTILARSVVEGRVADADRATALAALTLVLDDPSPKVRQALAEALATSDRAPASIIRALGEDIESIGCLVAGLSPVLSDIDLIDLAALGGKHRQVAIAGRSTVSVRLAAALAEVGGRTACVALLENEGAAIAGVSHRRIAERHGDDATIRTLQLQRDDVPVDVRQTLILHLGQALAGAPMVSRALGTARAQSMVSEACERATAALALDVAPAELPALVEHLRLSGQLTTAFLIRIVCAGNIDLFAAALVALSGLSDRRVRAIVVDGRDTAFAALVTSCGLARAAAPLLRTAIQVWKQAITQRIAPDLDAVAAEVMSRLCAVHRARGESAGLEALTTLLHRLESETTRHLARHRAEQLIAA